MEVNNENNDVNTDPDVNSWIFIEKNALDEPDNASVYFQNQVRIQEVTEDDLGSTESNSDSDGISVISENEDLQSQDECCTCLSEAKEQGDEDINTTIMNTNYNYGESTYRDTDNLENLQLFPKDSVAKNKIIYITTVTGMCFLATYFFWPKTVDFQEYVSDKIIYSEQDMTYDDNLNDVYDKQIWNNKYSNNTCDFNLYYNDFNSGNSFIQQIYSTIEKDISIPAVIHSTHFQNTQKQKGFRDIKIQKNSNNKPMKNPKNSKKDNMKMKNIKDKTTKSLKLKENYLSKKVKYLMKKEKYLKKIEREIYKLELKLQQTYRRLKKETGYYLNKNKLSTQKKGNAKKQTQYNITGDWYHNMYSGRSELRYREKLSDWMFERSKMRSKLREKESWYFSRVKGREQFRSNEKFHPGKYKIYKSYRY